MKLKRILSIILCIAMVTVSSLPNFAYETTTSEEKSTVESSIVESANEESTCEESSSKESTSEESTSEVVQSEESNSEKVEQSTETTTVSTENVTLRENSNEDIATKSEIVEEEIEISNISIATKSNADREDDIYEEEMIESLRNGLGYNAFDFDLEVDKIKNKYSKRTFGKTLDQKFDQREHTNDSGLCIVPPVRRQNPFGTCWVFSTLGMIETSIRIKNYVSTDEESNLSESAFAYFASSGLENVTNNASYIDKPGVEGRDYTTLYGDYFVAIGHPEWFNFAEVGGNQAEGTLLASTYMGIVLEDEYTEYTEAKVNNILASGLDGKYAFNSNAFEIGEVYIFDKNDIDEIKSAIVKNGSVGMSYYEGRNSTNTKKVDTEYYYLAPKKIYDESHNIINAETNHAVMVVGWDDTVSKDTFTYYNTEMGTTESVDADGAWLVRNSWGASNNNMHDGYFWISYKDPSLSSLFYSVDAIKKDTYKYNYHYDTTCSTSYGPKSNPFAQVYKVSDDFDQKLEAINLAVASSNAKYGVEIYINDNAMSNPTDGTLKTSMGVEKESAGVHLVVLNDPVYLKKGTYFSVVIKPYNTFSIFVDKSIDCRMTSPKVFYNEVELGQTFDLHSYGSNSFWDDCNDSNPDNFIKNGITYGTSYRIRALTNPTFSITFKPGGGDGEMTPQSIDKSGTTKLDPNKFTRDGYYFTGWVNEATGDRYDDEGNIDTTTDVTLTAEWALAKYSIKYMVDSDVTISTSSVIKTYTQNVTLEVPTKTGYVFYKWYSDNGLQNEYNGTTDLSSKHGDVKNIYPKWNPKEYDIILHDEGGTGSTTAYPTSYFAGDEVDLPMDLIKNDRNLVGWYDNASYTGTRYTKITSDARGIKELWAKYATDLTITYLPNGGTGTMDVQTFIEGKAPKLNPNLFTKSGYSFDGWLASNGGSYVNEATLPIQYDNLVMKAKWLEISNNNSNNNNNNNNGGGGSSSRGSSISAAAAAMNNTAITETRINVSMSSVPINRNTKNATWKSSGNGKWRLNVVNVFGVVEQVKNSWACINTDANINGQKVSVDNYYFFDNNGDMITGWITDNSGKKYYLETANTSEMGKMVRGWEKINGKYYYFDRNGILVTNGATPDGYKVDASGAWIR